MLSWEKVDAIPGWFQFQSYCIWRALLDQQGGCPEKIGHGSMMLFHSCLLHASTSNLSPWNRVTVYLSLCAVSNHVRRFKRTEYLAHRDFTPIETLPDDCLLKDYPVDLPWEKGMPASALQTSLEELKQAA